MPSPPRPPLFPYTTLFRSHGRSNSERQGDLEEKMERLLIEETTAAIEQHSGKRPRGWLGPWISQSPVTPDLLQEAGYRYLLDRKSTRLNSSHLGISYAVFC